MQMQKAGAILANNCSIHYRLFLINISVMIFYSDDFKPQLNFSALFLDFVVNCDPSIHKIQCAWFYGRLSAEFRELATLSTKEVRRMKCAWSLHIFPFDPRISSSWSLLFRAPLLCGKHVPLHIKTVHISASLLSQWESDVSGQSPKEIWSVWNRVSMVGHPG